MGHKDSDSYERDPASEKQASKDSATESPMERAYNDYQAGESANSLWESIMGIFRKQCTIPNVASGFRAGRHIFYSATRKFLKMSSEDEQNISERELVRDAVVNPSAREQLKKALLPHVAHSTKEFMKSRGIPEVREHELVEVGMASFDRVFNIYIKNARDREEKDGHFYKYYYWWMRKAISEYLHSQTKP